MLIAIPLLFIPVVIYAVVIGFGVLGSGGIAAAEQALRDPLFSIPMVSGSGWNVGAGDLILFLSLILLFFELLKSTSSQKVAIVNHALSMILFVFCLVAFLLFKGFATSTFFLIMVATAIDVVAGFTIGIRVARRDLAIGGSMD